MKIACVIYDSLTLLDFTCVYDPLTRLRARGFVPDLTYDTCGWKERIRLTEGAELMDYRCYRTG